jgi:hypothetical protein
LFVASRQWFIALTQYPRQSRLTLEASEAGSSKGQFGRAGALGAPTILVDSYMNPSMISVGKEEVSSGGLMSPKDT